MKNSLKYLILWRKKRNELQVDDDPQVDWQQMTSLLDEHLPVEKTSSKFKGLRILPTLFVAFTAAAMVYTASNIYSLEKTHHHHNNNKFYHRSRFNQGSPVADSTLMADSNAYQDSLGVLSQNAKGHDSLVVNSAGSKGGSNGAISPNGTLASNAVKGNTPANNGATKTNKGASNSATTKSGNSAAAKPGVKPTPILGSSTAYTVDKKPGVVSNRGILKYPGRQTRNSTPGSGHHANNPLVRSFTRNRPANSNGLPYGRGRQGNSAKPTGGGEYNAANVTNNAGLKPADLTNSTNNTNYLRAQPVLTVSSPWQQFDPFASSIKAMAATKIETPWQKPSTAAATGKNKNAKPAKVKNTNPSTTDWGLLMGVNSSGSFTPKNQNANFYGSGPVDPYFGVFASFKVNDSWAINPQIRLLSPQTVITTYSHANQSKVDSGQSLSVTASRKVYSVSIPIYVTYKATDNIKLKLGPVINIPVKQINASSVLSPATLRADSTYFANTTATL